jgi:hypothetical protein
VNRGGWQNNARTTLAEATKFNSVEEYLASLDPTKENTLRSVIDFILTQFPELESITPTRSATTPGESILI